MFTYVNLHYDWNRNIRLDVFCPFIELLTEQSNINPSLAAKKILTTIVLSVSEYIEPLTCPRAGPRGGEGEALPAGTYMRSTWDTAFLLAFPAILVAVRRKF